MAYIKVNSEAMRDKAASFGVIAGALKNHINDVNALVVSLKTVWEGDAMEETVKLYNSYAQDFENIIKAIESYQKFLSDAAERYDSTHTQNKDNAINSQK